MKVQISSPLQSYTKGIASVDIQKPTLNEVIDELDIQFPGIKFRFIDEQDRVRPNMGIFVNGKPTRNIFTTLEENSEIFIVHLVSGG